MKPPPRPRRIVEGIGLLLLAIAAILFQRSATHDWVEMSASNGATYRVSPIGLEQRQASASTYCRWWPHVGDQQLCAAPDTGGAVQMSWLRRVYPLTVVALYVSVLALFINALRVPRQAPVVGVIAALVPSALGATALWAMWDCAPGALAVLEGLAPHPLAGAWIMAIGTVLTTISAILVMLGRR